LCSNNIENQLFPIQIKIKNMKTITTLLIVLFSINSFAQKSVHDFKVKDIDGNEVSLSKYKGKVLVFINTASKCGLTPQYKDIQAFYEEYKSKGVEVLGFPANDFMGQEPGTEKEIKEFCSTKFAVTFPMFSKISVKGSNMAPLYKYLTDKKQNGVEDAPVKWNFQKFLVDKNGKLVKSFAPSTSVTDPDFISSVKGLVK
jgi:glutathione peroxidase